jgi:hypothetical protein
MERFSQAYGIWLFIIGRLLEAAFPLKKCCFCLCMQIFCSSDEILVEIKVDLVMIIEDFKK